MPSLEITTNIGCTLQCYYCPQKLLVQSYFGRANTPPKYLSFENFKIIVDKLPEYVRIHFSGMSEPWLNPDCTAMLEYSLEKGRKIAIFTTLVGMTEKDTDKICELLRKNANKMHKLYIHLPDASNKMQNWKISSEWDYAFRRFSSLYDEKIISNFIWMTMDNTAGIHPDVPPNNIVLSKEKMISRAGTLQTNEVILKTIDSPIICGRSIFYDRNVVLPNGDLLLCCMDYGMQHILGNILEEEYLSILKCNSIHALNGLFGSNNSICKKCHAAIAYGMSAKGIWEPKGNATYSWHWFIHYCKQMLKFYLMKIKG